MPRQAVDDQHFPSYLEGLSLRPIVTRAAGVNETFPFLFGRAFIEAEIAAELNITLDGEFPFLFGRAFIEAHYGE